MSTDGQSNRAVLRPAQLNALARDLLEGVFPLIWVEGEISNFSRPASGHIYFTLKDERAQVRCALFKPKSQWLRFKPDNGMQVLTRGRLTVYEPRGDYQLLLDHLEPAGEGALRRAFERLRAKLAAEGLFDGERKRPLPRFIRRIAVLTSPSGAAIGDVLSVLARRFPLVEVDLLPVPVQGETAAAVIAATLHKALTTQRYDVLLLTRGGGALEDLWPFNDETLTRAIAAADRPIVSAVGHEIDVTLADLAADLRAPTPSAAAELLVPDSTELIAELHRQRQMLHRAITRTLRDRSQQLDHALLRLRNTGAVARLARDRLRFIDLERRLTVAIRLPLAQRRQRLASTQAPLKTCHPQRLLQTLRRQLHRLHEQNRLATARFIERQNARLTTLGRTLHAISPLATLTRGYAIVFDENRRAVRSQCDVKPGQRLRIRLADGEVNARIEKDK